MHSGRIFTNPAKKMIFIAVFAATICVAVSVPPPSSCVVGTWGEWSECHGMKSCATPPVARSQPMSDEKKALGKGREAMKKIVAMKNAGYARRVACIEDGTCPENLPPKSVREFTPCVDGDAGGYPCSNVDMLSFLNFDQLGYTESTVEGNDIWVWHDTLSDPQQHYALMGLTHGTSFVRVTDPENPEVIGILRTETSPSSWRDMKVVGDYAFIVSEARDHGMQVFDLNTLRGKEADPSREFTANATYDGVSNTHNIVANPASNTVFLVGSTISVNPGPDCHFGGLHMVDVSDPLNPTFAGCFDNDGYVHDAQCLFYDGPDTEHNGREICYCFNEDSFTIVDVTDKTNSLMLSRVEYDGVSYSHQGWATEDNRFLLLDDELDEFGSPNTKTYIWNIEDLDDPINTNVHVSTETSSDHNLYITGSYAHQSNYMAGYRLQEIDPTDGTLTEVAYFDVFPPQTSPGFQGTWSNYPWLSDDNGQYVVVTSIDYGLFILRPNYAAIEASKGTNSGYTRRYRDAIYGTKGAQCPALVESKPCTPQAC